MGDADAGGDDGLPPADHDRLGHAVGHPFGDVAGFPVADVLADDDELVAGQAADGVVGPDHGPEPFRDRQEHAVAGRVAERVVDQLEAVEIGEEHGHPPARPVRTGQCLVEAVEDEAAVGQPGQRVVGGLVHGVVEGAAHPVDGGRVVEGERGVLGEGEEHLLLGGGVVAGLERSDEEAADDGAVAVDGAAMAERRPWEARAWWA